MRVEEGAKTGWRCWRYEDVRDGGGGGRRKVAELGALSERDARDCLIGEKAFECKVAGPERSASVLLVKGRVVRTLLRDWLDVILSFETISLVPQVI